MCAAVAMEYVVFDVKIWAHNFFFLMHHCINVHMECEGKKRENRDIHTAYTD